MASIRKWIPLFALLLIFGGCPAVDATPAGGGETPTVQDPPTEPPPTEDPPADPPPPGEPPTTPPPGGDGPSLDPGFNPSTNLIDFYFDPSLTDAQNGDLLEDELESLQAGDLLRIHAGHYVVNGRIGVDAAGTEADPITIEAAEGEQVTITRDNENQNTFNVDSGSWLTIRGLEIAGGSSGFKINTGGFHHLYFVGNHVHHTGESAIAANSANTSYLYFVDNHIHDIGGHGEGFYLGANFAAYITHHTWVVGNYVHHTQGTQGDGIEIKTGSYAVTISDNVIEDTQYPGVLVYGNGGHSERNIIERNVIVRSAEGGIQAAADAVIRNNLIIDCAEACIVSVSHQDADPGNLTVVHNTLVNSGRLFYANWGSATGVLVANNALYTTTGEVFRHDSSGDATLVSNVVLSGLDAFVNVSLDGVDRDATPSSGSALIGAGDSNYVTTYDLNGKERSGAVDAGAVDAD